MQIQQELIDVARNYARAHANADGLAMTPIPPLRMMCVSVPQGQLQSIYRPLICMVLQGRKHLLVGQQAQTCGAGTSVIVAADMPVTGQVIEASPANPYIALAIELDMALLRELSNALGNAEQLTLPDNRTLFLQSCDQAVLGCGLRLMQLIQIPDAVPLILPGIMKELHFWLLAGPHGTHLRAIMAPQSCASRLRPAVDILKAEYRTKIPTARLATAASMSTAALHKHFKALTSLTPGQYQKRLRLIEARRQMLYEGASASAAAYAVGYESVSQFSHDYSRLFGAPPKRDARSLIQARVC